MLSRSLSHRFKLNAIIATAIIATQFTVANFGAKVALAAELRVTSALAIQTAMQVAQPGDTLVMANGTWTNQQIDFEGFGTENNPITLRAETPGEVLLNGNSSLDISGDWLHVEGLRFEGGSLSSGHVVEFKGSYGEATNSRFSNSAIIDYNPVDVNTRYQWVSLHGQNNRVDNNRFEGQNHSGVTVVVWRDDASADYHLIDNNHFVDRPEPINPESTNGFESIRIGTGEFALSDSFTTVQNNLFERADGEIEIISNKSENNTFRHNTFRESKGTLTLRRGNNNLVEGNFFLGQNKTGTGGIRVIGEEQKIINNYIANVDDRADGAISLSAGIPSSEPATYFQVKDALISHNTIINTSSTMLNFDQGFDSLDRPLRPENVTVTNNLFRSLGPTIFEGTEGVGWTWEGNIAYGGDLGPKAGAAGITVVDPQLQLQDDGLWRVSSSSSPVINSGVGDYSTVSTFDMDGQPRIGIFDVGADEFSDVQIVRKPLESKDVGPDWITQHEIPTSGGGGCFASGCAIQAEDYQSLIDPDGNGLVWNTVIDTDALGSQALSAPNGSRIDVPGEAHDTIAVYEISFSQAGTYRSYFRAKGFSTGTDSIYLPEDFGLDPTTSDTTSSNSEYRWEVGGLFTVTESHVGVPLEIRVARREESTRFDSFVLNLDLSLNATELDALFDFLAGDFNDDGIVDAADYTVWRDSYQQVGANLPADANDDQIVNLEDYELWVANYGASLTTSDNSGIGLSVSANTIPEPSSSSLILLSLFSAIAIRPSVDK